MPVCRYRPSTSVSPTWPQVFDLFGTPLVIEPSAAQFSRDTGLLSIGPFDEPIGLNLAFA